jgi:chromosome segregation ATPase
MCDDNDLLYGDLEKAGKSAEFLKIRQSLLEEKSKNSSLREECDMLRSQINALVNDRKQLETNMVSLFNTAMAEIKRKEREIGELRARLSSLTT